MSQPNSTSTWVGAWLNNGYPGNGNQSLQAESLKNVMLNIYSFMPVIFFSLSRKEMKKLYIILDSMGIYASHHQLLIWYCMRCITCGQSSFCRINWLICRINWIIDKLTSTFLSYFLLIFFLGRLHLLGRHAGRNETLLLTFLLY